MSYPDSSVSPYSRLSPIEEMAGLSSPAHSTKSLPSTEQPITTVATSSSDPAHNFVSAHFEKQPPDNMRKSNFFNFIISIFDSNRQPVEIQKALFKDFFDTTINGQEYRNGLIYSLTVVYSDGTLKEEDLYVRLIDSATKQLVLYEGTCKNPDFRRVLLTHELICSRCLEHRSCGNKNDTPSDPIVVDRYHLKFFMKCNQNCLKNAGNPKDSRRRFQVALYVSPHDQLKDSPIACSESMFVHNNSKHGRKAPVFREAVVGDGKPYIISVYPKEGWTTGGTRVCIVGNNFYDGIEVVFGTLPASSEVLSPNAIAVRAPQNPRPGEVDITLVFNGSQFCINNPGKFLYVDLSEESALDQQFNRLERVLTSPEDPPMSLSREVILKRAADTLETVLYGSRPPGHVATSGPLNHINPMYYPKSPAFITPTAIFTSQGLTPTRFGPSFPAGALVSPGKFIHGQPPGAYHLDTRKGDVEGGSTSGVSRCSSNETVIQQSMDSSTNPAYFTFPQQAPEGMVDIKHEHGIAAAQPGGIHKPKPLTPAGFYSAAVAMPFVQVHPAHSQGASYMGNPSMGFHMSDLGNGGSASFMNQINPNDGSNRNNNNSVASMTHNFPLFIPPSSTGFLMAPTVSPGPLPTTPTGGAPGGNHSFFNFAGPPMVSPGKQFRGGQGAGKTGKPAPLSVPSSELGSSFNMINYPPSIFAALPSPNIPGTFMFPPSTPTGQLIAPIHLPDLSAATDTTATTSASLPTESVTPGDSEAVEPPAKKSREDSDQ